MNNDKKTTAMGLVTGGSIVAGVIAHYMNIPPEKILQVQDYIIYILGIVSGGAISALGLFTNKQN